jgi:hypothetical protein
MGRYRPFKKATDHGYRLLGGLLAAVVISKAGKKVGSWYPKWNPPWRRR